VTSQLSAALRAAAAGIHPDEAAAGLISAPRASSNEEGGG
jgi:hypothetical protein